jgi:hypothetical protein
LPRNCEWSSYLTVATIDFAVFILYRFMHREKREEIQRLEDEPRSYMMNP